MGALIRTWGTIELLKLLNKEFSTHLQIHRNANIDAGNGPWAGQPIKDQFDKSKHDRSLAEIVDNVRHAHAGGSGSLHDCCFQHRDIGLAARWSTFLGGLPRPVSDKIRDKIFEGLNGPQYDFVQFDCVDGSSLTGMPDVSAEKETDYAGNHVSATYMKIVLLTTPMPGTPAQAVGGAKAE